MVRKYTDEQLLQRVTEVEGFTNIPKGRWILGVRSNEDLFNTYDDKFYIFQGKKFIDVMTGTTNAGEVFIKGGFKKYNKNGVAIVKADMWHNDVWEYGLHRGKMPSLRQTGAKISIYRDNDMDKRTEEWGEVYRGYFGINFHSNTYNFSEDNLKVTRNTINSWSAGCQVINQRDRYIKQIEWFRNAQKSRLQKKVSYCLLNEFKPKL